jgi:hypothetical protein
LNHLAVISVSALALAVLVSCVSRLNVGVLSLALAWIVGVYIGGMPVNTVMSGFPSQLFLTLAGVTLLFSMAQCNGTLERLTHHAVRSVAGTAASIPVMFSKARRSSIGPGTSRRRCWPARDGDGGANGHSAVSHGDHGRQRRQLGRPRRSRLPGSS